MSTSLKSLAWQYIDQISGGNRTTDSRIDERDIILTIRKLMNEVMDLKYFEKYQEGDKSAISLYISTYSLILQNDNTLNRAYILLPEFYKTLPSNRGIHEMWLLNHPDQSIILTHNQRVSRNLRAGNVFDIIYAYAEGLRIYFRNLSVKPGYTETIVLQLIIAGPDSIGINDPLPIIPEQQSEILRRLMVFYKGAVPLDLTVNANPNA